MLCAMYDSQRPSRRDTPGADVDFNWPLVRQRCAELGATKTRDAARLMGMASRTLDGLRFGHRDTKLGTILRAAEILNLDLGDMFIRRDQRDDVAA
jgi:hypothetical protein